MVQIENIGAMVRIVSGFFEIKNSGVLTVSDFSEIKNSGVCSDSTFSFGMVKDQKNKTYVLIFDSDTKALATYLGR